MKFISHRGCTNGPSSAENTQELIDFAIHEGYDVEIDVWAKKGALYLGHDEPEIECSMDFIAERSDSLWIHCKNPESLRVLSWYGLNVFSHDKDRFVATTWGYIWTADHYCFQRGAIAVLPEKSPKKNLRECDGICSDFIEMYKEDYDV